MIWFVYTFNCDVFWPLELFLSERITKIVIKDMLFDRL